MNGGAWRRQQARSGAPAMAATPDPWEAADLALEEGDHWLLSYVDILTLLLTLLVVLLVLGSVPDSGGVPAPSPVRAEHGSAAATSIMPIRRQAPGSEMEQLLRLDPALTRMADLAPPEVKIPQPREPQESKPANPAPPAATPESSVADPLEQLIAGYDDGRLRVTRISQGVNLEMRDSILFAPGSATPTAGGRALLADLATVLAAADGTISVEGHTDDRPIATARFPSNWELSTGRATAVARLLVAGGVDARRVRAIGYGSTRPLADNATPEGRARNRRVSLVVHLAPEAPTPAP